MASERVLIIDWITTACKKVHGEEKHSHLRIQKYGITTKMEDYKVNIQQGLNENTVTLPKEDLHS